MFAQDQLLRTRPLERLSAGVVLQRRGVGGDYVVYVEHGAVGLGVMGAFDLEHCLGQTQGPSWLEPCAAILQAACAVDAITQTVVAIRRVPTADFRDALHSAGASVRRIVKDLARTHYEQTQMAVSRLIQDAEGRCAQWLLQHARGAGNGQYVVEFRDPKRQVAQRLGIAPETLSRVFKLLRERGLIAGSGRILEVLDLGALRVLAGA